MRTVILYILYISFCSITNAQVLMNKDSLLKLLPTVKEDSAGVEFYINLGQQYEASEPELAKHYYKTAGTFSEKIDYPAGILRYIFNYTFVLNMQGRFDSGLALNLKSVAIARKLNDPIMLGKALFNTGSSYRMLAQYENAIPLYEEGRKIFASNGDSLLMARSYDIIQMLYYNLENYDKGVFYGETAVKWLRTIDDPVWLGTTLNNLGMNYAKKGAYAKAKDCWMEALAIGKKIGNIEMEASQMLNLGDLYMDEGDYAVIGQYYNKALELYTTLDGAEGIAIALRGLAIYEFYKKDFQAAKIYADRSLAVINQNNLLFEKRKTFETLSRIHIALHDLITGQKYMQQATVLADSIINDRIRKSTVEFETKYETAKKDGQIKLQQSELKQKSTLNYILIGSAAALLIISLLSYRNYRHKQNLQQQRINELETEKQLAATEAVLKGEEQERTRLAKDLHDGLGGMLSGIKHSFNNMKGNLVMTPENAQAFERSMDMLDSSIKEMRRVAHNMMPETLVKYGLDTALKDFCKDMSLAGSVKVIYQSVSIENAVIDQTTSITIYRIVQELVNNVMKHAAAKQVVVQLNKLNGQLTITVEDDGKGFDTAILRQSSGMGWSNILNRVEFMKGIMDVQSEPGKGTSVHIELKA
ncbi:tetratricopeptide repeat-containing sensor histidine kinase [Lacibacter sediminis]|uniref:Sensor histidine kinase n=1 Tax=Lacibacter sediminis TaxID=2760713 RepID=A0A7G5XLN8_9BACT|nr:sensor histidine kinase [Lacibacter sediminis]QNA46391.1 sensor histidine kinase [Lacibacter sediminis]